MKIRKFYKQEVHQVDGPGKKLNFLGEKNEITEAEAQQQLDAFFDEHEADNAEKVKAYAWTSILNGKEISFDNTCISSRLFTVADKRIASRSSIVKS